MPESVAENFKRVQERVAVAAARAGRRPEEITIIGASKLVEPERMIQAYDAGLRHFGENYVQEAMAKIPQIEGLARKVEGWHYIGVMQESNIRHYANNFDMVHTIADIGKARVLARHVQKSGRPSPLSVLIEVNLAEEKTKAGIAPERLADLALKVNELYSLHLIGLMAMPPITPNPEDSRVYFRQLRELRDGLQGQIPSLTELSMGTTLDFEVAIAEGATMVRIGTAIFGERPPR